METLNINKTKKESKKLEKLYKRYGRVSQQMQKELEKMGYTFCELGSGSRSRTSSGVIGTHYFANDETPYFGIGVSNISRGKASNGCSVIVFRAWVKEINFKNTRR